MVDEHKWYYEKQGELIGPIDTGTMCNMIISGGLTATTHVWRDGLIGRQPIATIPELAGYLPDPSASPALHGVFPGSSQGVVQPVAATHAPHSGSTSGLAVTSLVLGIISLALFCLVPISLPCGIIGLILGLTANKGPYKQPLATAGIVTSIAGSLIGVLLVIGAVTNQDNQPNGGGFDEFFDIPVKVQEDQEEAFEDAFEEAFEEAFKEEFKQVLGEDNEEVKEEEKEEARE